MQLTFLDVIKVSVLAGIFLIPAVICIFFPGFIMEKGKKAVRIVGVFMFIMLAVIVYLQLSVEHLANLMNVIGE